MAKKVTLKAEIAAMNNDELLKDLTRSTRMAWAEFLRAHTREDHKKVIYGKSHYRERRLAAEVLRRMNLAY